jgi:DNA topoisomerase-1
MRTDSTRVSPDAQVAALAYVKGTFGDAFAPASPNQYRTKKSAQDAHEAIRPTSLDFPPDRVKEFLPSDEFKVYTLIWNRFLASQMAPAVYDQTSVDIEAAGGRFRASGQVLRFAGFLRVYEEGRDAPDENDDSGTLPDLKEGEKLGLDELAKSQHFTQPPPRFTQATLIRALEELGIGRPSTYAAIMSTIIGREYVRQDEQRRRREPGGHRALGLEAVRRRPVVVLFHRVVEGKPVVGERNRAGAISRPHHRLLVKPP